jgi:hypothetical protein
MIPTVEQPQTYASHSTVIGIGPLEPLASLIKKMTAKYAEIADCAS